MKTAWKTVGGARLKVAALGAAASLCLASPFAQAASSQDDVDQLGRNISVLEGEMVRLKREFVTVPEISAYGNIQERLNQGQLFFALKDFHRASLTLFAVIRAPEIQDSPEQADALYALAESLLQQRYFHGARRYYAELLEHPAGSRRSLAIRKLIEIGATLRDWPSVDKYYARFVADHTGAVPDDVRYVRGKGLLSAQKFQDAVDTMASVERTSAFYLRAQYVMGAAQVAQGEFDRALETFAGVTKATPKEESDAAVIELAHMARARIFYEQDKLDEAVNAYQAVGKDSERLLEMLYEITWVYVRRGQLAFVETKDGTLNEEERRARAGEEYKSALETLDLLTTLAGDTRQRPELLILKGNLHIQRDELLLADQVFHEILAEYEPTDKVLRGLKAGDVAPRRILDDVISVQEGGLTVDSILPSTAAAWAAEKQDVSGELRVFFDIQESEREIAETEEILHKLRRVLDKKDETPEDLFPAIGRGVGRLANLSNRALALESQLTEQVAVLIKDAPADLRAKLEEGAARIRRLKDKLDKLPKSAKAFDERQANYLGGIRTLREQLFETQQLLNRYRAEVVALDRLLSDSVFVKGRSEEDLAVFRKRLRAFNAEATALAQTRDLIADEIEQAYEDYVLASGASLSERQLREALQEALESQAKLLDSAPEAGETGQLLAQLVAFRTRLANVNADNGTLSDRLRASARVQLEKLWSVVREEEQRVSSFRQRVASQSVEADGVAAQSARLVLDTVSDDFARIVLRADVGVADTAFQAKQLETRALGRLQRAQAQELTELNRAYAELVQDEVQ